MARILLVEDDRAIGAVVVQALSEDGHAVTLIEDGQDALEWLERERVPELILLDWRLPGLSGAEVARRYADLPPPHAPIVILTAAQDVVDAAIQAGAQGFLRKPFDLREVEAIVSRMVRTHEPAAAVAFKRAWEGEGRPGIGLSGPEAAIRAKSESGRWEAEKRRLLSRMLHEVSELHRTLSNVQEASLALNTIERTRLLTREERRRGSELNVQSTAVRLRLEVLRKEFDELTRGHTPFAKPK